MPFPTRVKLDEPVPLPNGEDIDFFNQLKDGPNDFNIESIIDRWRKQQS